MLRSKAIRGCAFLRAAVSYYTHLKRYLYRLGTSFTSSPEQKQVLGSILSPNPVFWWISTCILYTLQIIFHILCCLLAFGPNNWVHSCSCVINWPTQTLVLYITNIGQRYQYYAAEECLVKCCAAFLSLLSDANMNTSQHDCGFVCCIKITWRRRKICSECNW